MENMKNNIVTVDQFAKVMAVYEHLGTLCKRADDEHDYESWTDYANSIGEIDFLTSVEGLSGPGARISDEAMESVLRIVKEHDTLGYLRDRDGYARQMAAMLARK